MTARPIAGLYAVTPDTEDTARLIRLVEATLEGGARIVQYRNKIAAPALKLAQARALKAVCVEHDALFIVNDDVGVAREVDADGVHVGRDDPALATARETLGREKVIGVSCYRSLALAREAQGAGADYVAFGSFFPSRVKPGAVRAPVELLTDAKRELSVPVVAIGGITAANGGELVRAGADALAVISALFDADDVTAAAAAFGPLFASR
ncbi:MAG TPA: thiamine phosphate synthase [Burkholderiales bacterium]|nr:thiamine phosphate synthase [Burkholderiales bacterium]